MKSVFGGGGRLGHLDTPSAHKLVLFHCAHPNADGMPKGLHCSGCGPPFHAAQKAALGLWEGGKGKGETSRGRPICNELLRTRRDR